MNDDHSPDRFERHLVDLLDERAGRIVVEPDLAALSRSGNITEAAPDAVRLNRLTQPIAVAAALVVVAMLWGYLARGNAPARTSPSSTWRAPLPPPRPAWG